MALFRKDPEKAGAQPLANTGINVKYNGKNEQGKIPLNSQDYAEWALNQQAPYDMGFKTPYSNENVNIKNFIETNNSNTSIDNAIAPNFFGKWKDIYQAWLGNWILETSDKRLKRLEQLMYHQLFMSNNFALRKINDKWIIGVATIDTCDYLGRLVTGKFTPYNHLDNKENKEKSVAITKSNNKDFITFNLGVFKIPLFVAIQYFVNQRQRLWEFKEINLGASATKAVVYVKGNNGTLWQRALDKILNYKRKDFGSPVRVLDSSGTGNSIQDTGINFNDSIQFNNEYLGSDILADIEGLTKEIYRIAGIRTDVTQHSSTYSEKPTEAQGLQSQIYFDNTEHYILMSFENFAYDFKEKFGIDIKFSTTNMKVQVEQKEQEKEQENEEMTNFNPNK